YSKSAMSVGAAVYERDRADLKLSSEAQRAIGVSIEEITGDDLIRAILCADVDLLWNGGIGTYVKAQNERNEDVGDSSNDLVRINGKQLRAKVVGEGGNLGFTMHGRYEAALAGVRLNTDAVDNSGGVDMSDHEVNLKILLSNLMQTGAIQSIEDRNKIIRQLEPVMIDQVLSNNRSIQIAIQLERLRLENESSVLPIWLNELLAAGAYQSHQLPEDLRQFTSPFLSNLVGWSKLRYLSHLDLANSLPRSELQEAVWQRFSNLPFDKSIIEDGLNRHSLHDTIAKTEIINRIVHHAGPLFIFRVAKQLGLPEEIIVHLRLQMERWLGVDQLREKINTTVDYRSILSTILQLEEILERAIFVFPTELLMAGLLTDMISRSQLHTSEMSVNGFGSLVDRIRLDVRQIPKDQHEVALQKLSELQADELEKGIRRIPIT
ncbi:MAG: NAD-glutamate dehydrogenase, partial [Leptonema sp. (in: Bacteria)]|nr:NAD-glutamate dehydrogenase [Leptonema sp. (in: bacteria)]